MVERLQLLELLGRPSSDPMVDSALQTLKISRRPSIERDEVSDTILETQDWLRNLHMGVELGFEDEVAFAGLHPDDIGTGPMLLTHVYFYGKHPGTEPFRGRLPMGIQVEDDRATVRAKLAGWEATRRSYIRDTWELPAYRMTIGYADQYACIDFVLCFLRQPPLPADRDDAELVPGIGDILSVIGKPLDDPQLRRVFAPLRLEQKLEDDSGGLIAEYRLRFGFEIRFGYIGGGAMLQLTYFNLFREHDVDGARWPGQLPQGLSFDDSPERAMQKFGRAADELVDLEYVSYALWRFPDSAIQVKYSTMENFILRVRISAPGVV